MLTGRYHWRNKTEIVCEAHFAPKERCDRCGLACTGPVVRVNTKTYHPLCLVCAYCLVPLHAGALNVGPDGEYYCGLHAQGVCAVPGCSQPCWADGQAVHRVAGQYFCGPHFNHLGKAFREEVCARCEEAIRVEEEGMEFEEGLYHPECFVCAVCTQEFEDGAEIKTIPGSKAIVHPRCVGS